MKAHRKTKSKKRKGDLLFGFVKTKHFKTRQENRDVSNDELQITLSKLKISKGKRLLVVSRRLIREKLKKKCLDLFIKIDGKVLITCFYCDFQDYLNSKKRENFQIIS